VGERHVSNLGEWDSVDDNLDTADHTPESSDAASSPLASAVAAALRSADLGAAVETAVQRAVQKRVDKVAAEAVHAVVDQDVDALARLRTAAEESVTVALTNAGGQDQAAGEGNGEGEQGTPQLYYPTLEAFVRDQLAPMYRRDVEGRIRFWCVQWWRHAEAIARLEALWRAWEHLRLDPATGMSVWFRDHADHHMNILFDPEGPFKRCAKGHGERLKALPIDAPPPGMFREDSEPASR
jgi:hypothetical protein